MTKEPITENDRLIAEFMGLRIDSFPDKSDWWFVDAPNNFDSIYHNENESLFSSDWSWLMPVVERIESLKHWTVTIVGYCVSISSGASDYFLKHHRDKFYSFPNAEHATKIENTYDAVVRFIKWHNEQKFK